MEVEIKARVENPNSMIDRLKKLGAVLQREVLEIDEYFNHPCRDFGQTDEAIRIRNDFTLTYKGPKVDTDTKSREEITMKINDINEARTLLEKLGFLFVAKVKKIRRYYSLGTTTITIDNVEDLGYFMEIECIGEYNPCREKVLDIAKTLHLHEFITKSYLEMILENIHKK